MAHRSRPHVVTIIVNPRSGRGRAARLLPFVTDALFQAMPDSQIRVVRTRDYADARAHLDQKLPAVLILDLHLQHGSGWSLLSYLRGRPQAEKTKVFIYTASDLSLAEREQLKAQFVSIVQKHGQDSLRELVQSIVGKTFRQAD